MKSIQRNGDRIEVELEPREAAWLAAFPGQLADELRAPRTMSDDPSANQELHELLDAELAARRLERTRLFAERLSRVDAEGGLLSLTLDEAEGWLMVLTDLRLALAAQLGLRDEADAERWARTRPTRPTERQYLYLSHLQSALLARGFEIE